MSGYTLTEAQAHLQTWLAADTAVAAGQGYEIAGRKLTRANATEITSKIKFWNGEVALLTRQSRGRSRARTVVAGG